ncbi:MAG: 6-bladed beta-propeller [Acidobacteriota bacterium]|nr:6-bladed beta-propeller [Acidobacteriota bacterium]
MKKLVLAIMLVWPVMALVSAFMSPVPPGPQAEPYALSLKKELLKNHPIQSEWTRLKIKREFPTEDDERQGHYLTNPSDIVLLDDGSIIAIENLHSFIMKLSAQGSYLSTFGRKGQGPGDFMHPWNGDVSEDGDLYILDSQRMSVMSKEGQFLRGFKVLFRFHDFIVFKDNIWANCTYPDENKNPLIIRIDQNGKLLDAFGDRLDIPGHFSFDSEVFLGKLESGIIAAFHRHPIVRIYSFQGELLQEIRIDLKILKELEKLNTDKAYNNRKPENIPYPRLPRLIAGVTTIKNRIFVLLHLPRIEILELDAAGNIVEHYYCPDKTDIINYGRGLIAFQDRHGIHFCLTSSVDAKVLFLESVVSPSSAK